MRYAIRHNHLLCAAVLGLLLEAAGAGRTQTPVPAFEPVEPLRFSMDGPVLRSHAEAEKPFTVAGERGVLLGQQNGVFEAWVLPVKLLSHLTIEANIDGYPVPIDVNRQAAEIEVRPERTTLTFSHIGFTLREILFSPNTATGVSGALTGPVALFEFDCLRPTDFVLRFTPELRWMWPERNEGTPGVEWVEAGGYYVLHSDYPDLAGAVTIPGARPGILAPYQERPQNHPVELKLHIDPARDRGKLFPLLMAVGATPATATNAALGTALAELDKNIPAAYEAHAESWKKLRASSTSIETPDAALNEAFPWAVVSIEQLRARGLTSVERKDGSATPETALVAGYYASGDSARPGFGWFFGRDALYTLSAVDGYGDFALARSELEFLMARQRADGKIMHEYSQTAGFVDWQAFPYMYAAADATPLFLLAVEDYVRSSGDTAFLSAHRDAVEKAWAFETSHDSDGDGIYDNAQGTGWVESWPGGLPHQEIYLAELDRQASAAMAALEDLLKDAKLAGAARERAAKIAQTVEREYYDAEKGCYAFSRNVDGGLDRTVTVYPALAWWSGSPELAHGDDCLQQFASHRLMTDWGLRDVAGDEKLYDGMSYHQGSVWPLFTGWAAMAEYRGNQPIAGYRMLMENANLTRAQDLGAVTELLSGDFFVPFGRSTSHQLWSSAMVITPTLRGLFGIEVDAGKKTVTVHPHLPASWDHAEVLNLPLPGGPASLYFTQKGATLEVALSAGSDWQLKSDLPGATDGPLERGGFSAAGVALNGLRIPLPMLDVDPSPGELHLIESLQATDPSRPPLPGARTMKFRILRTEHGEHKLTIVAEGLAGSAGLVRLVRRGHFIPEVQSGPEAAREPGAEAASISYRGCDADPYACAALPLILNFPAGEGWKTMTVTLAW